MPYYRVPTRAAIPQPKVRIHLPIYDEHLGRKVIRVISRRFSLDAKEMARANPFWTLVLLQLGIRGYLLSEYKQLS
jgi:hypothetical protein